MTFCTATINENERLMIKRLLILFFLILVSQLIHAEGTRQVAPNGNITVEGNPTTDIAALLIHDDRYGDFASYTNDDPNSRLYINIQDPAGECIYLGFSYAHPNANSPNPLAYDYEYRIKDPNGNIVFGPVMVEGTNANIQNWQEAYNGPSQLVGAEGYNAMVVTPAQLTSQGWSGKGNYYIEFQSPSAPASRPEFLIDFWDITVVNCTPAFPEERPGRVWSYNWAFFAVNDYGFPNRPFNGAFYVCAPDPDDPAFAFITKIDFQGSGFQPAAFNVAFNSFGAQNTGDIPVDRRSVELMNLTQAEYEIFLNDPIDICQTAEAGEIELLGVGQCPGDNGYCINFIASKEGQIDLLLDFDGPDDIFTPGTADIMVTQRVEADEVGRVSCVPWDGNDGLGNLVPPDPSTPVPVVINYAQGVYHFPVYDAEYMINGFNIQAVRPAADQPLLFYDDSGISVSSGSGEPAVQLMGCSLPCHRWTNFTDNETPGFGNVNTINSWWFSQLIVRKETFFFPGELVCAIEGPARICAGDSATLVSSFSVLPAGASGIEVVGRTWTGPGVDGFQDQETLKAAEEGTYTLDIAWANGAGDTCVSTCSFDLQVLPNSAEQIDTLIVEGESVEINGEIFNNAGIYTQNLVAANGCDSILTIVVNVIQTVVRYSLDACRSYTDDGSAADYSEFTAEVPSPVNCADVVPGILYRENPEINTHSCTPGVFDSPAMCVDAQDTCRYDPGSEKSVIFELSVTPGSDTAVAITGLSFYEKAPDMFDWIDGPSGMNNYPTLYGVRVLKDGAVIFEEKDIQTTMDWTLEEFDFLGNQDFMIDQPAVFRFELLAYCLFGNNAPVAAWDLDEVSVQASCTSPDQLLRTISGGISALQDLPLENVRFQVAHMPDFNEMLIDTLIDSGMFSIQDLKNGEDYYIRPMKRNAYKMGVSTLDLVRIQQHLLNIQPFERNEQYVAADANRSNSVTALDLVELKKLLLGIYDILPDNDSWRFVVVSDHGQAGSPFDFDEVLSLPTLEQNMNNVFFAGIKVGDVNGVPDNFAGKEIFARQEGIILGFRDRYVQRGEVFSLGIGIESAIDLLGLQLTFSTIGLEIRDVFSGAMDLEKDLTWAKDDSSRLHFSWFVPETQHFASKEDLFSLDLVALESGILSQMLRLEEEDLHPEGYLQEQQAVIPVPIRMEPRVHLSEMEGFIVRIRPNPASEKVWIEVELEQDARIDMQVISLSGNVMGTFSVEGVRGLNVLDVSKAALHAGEGMVFFRIQAGNQVTFEKVIFKE